jgi:hypothetical protein
MESSWGDLDSVRIYVLVERWPQTARVSVRPMPQDVLSYCRICAAACGITVTVDAERVV